MGNIRQATEQDLPFMLDLIQTCFRGEASLKGWTNEGNIISGNRVTYDVLKKEMETRTFLNYKDDNGNLIGLVYYDYHPENNKLSFGTLSIHPAHQSKGIGGMMLRYIEKLARDKGCDSICLHVVNVRDELIQWYERLGFRKTGNWEQFPGDSEPEKFGTPIVKGITLIEMEYPLK